MKESLQQIIVRLFNQSKKLVPFILIVMFCSGMGRILDCYFLQKHQQLFSAKLHNITILATQKEDPQKALNDLNQLIINEQNNKFLTWLHGRSQRNAQLLLLLQKVKIEHAASKVTQQTQEKVKNIDYMSMSKDFLESSIAGEVLLNLKLFFYYFNNEYKECIDTINLCGMNTNLHRLSQFFKIFSMQNLGNPDYTRVAKNFSINFQNFDSKDLNTLGIFDLKPNAINAIQEIFEGLCV